MNLIASLLSIGLAVVFATAAIMKIRGRRSARQAVRDFGVPVALAGPVAIALPVAELATAAALVWPATAAWGARAAFALLAVFSAGIAINLARGNRPDCNCFGQAAPGPIGWRTLARNAVLAGLSLAVLVAADGASLFPPIGDIDPTGLVVVFVAAGFVILAALLLNVIAQNGRLLVRIEALEARAAGAAVPAPKIAGHPIGTPAPSFSLTGLRGETMTLEALRAGEMPVVLLFSDAGCGPCNSLLPEVGRWQREYASRVAVAVISRGTIEANRAKSSEHGLRTVLLQHDGEVAASYGATGTPSAVLVRPDGTIGSLLAEGGPAIASLVAAVSGTAAPVHDHGQCGNGAAMVPGSAGIGEPAPAVRLPDLTGRGVDLAELSGPTLVVFWNPACGFCSQMLGDLRSWEEKMSPRDPRLLIVSTGSVEANQALGLRSTVVIDPDFATARAFGVSGTPSAVLVDADRKIASLVAVGAPAVLALASAEQAAIQP